MTRRRPARSGQALLLAAFTASGAAAAADASPVAEDFLEYLGSWESDDADWLVAITVAVTDTAPPAAPARTARETVGAPAPDDGPDRLPPRVTATPAGPFLG